MLGGKKLVQSAFKSGDSNKSREHEKKHRTSIGANPALLKIYEDKKQYDPHK